MSVWHKLAQKFDIRMLRKEYSGRNEEILSQWGEAIGPQNITTIVDPLRVVDHGMGLVAKKWGHVDDFATNLSARQSELVVESVMASIKAAPGLEPGKDSTYLNKASGSKSKSLLEDEK